MDSGLRQEAHPAARQTAPVRRIGGVAPFVIVKGQKRKRYPSIAVCVGDGFREGLNPSYALGRVSSFISHMTLDGHHLPDSKDRFPSTYQFAYGSTLHIIQRLAALSDSNRPQPNQ